MTVACYPLDAVSGAPAYTGRMLRDTISALLGGASTARPLGTRSGVRPGTPTSTVTLSGLNWTLKPHAGVLDVEAAAEAGPYLYAVTANETGTLNAQAVGNARTDLLVMQLSDPAEGDGTSVPKAEPVYVAGTAGPGAPAPAVPARSLLLARFNVPQSGGGSPTVTWVAPTLSAAGARPSVATIADLALLSQYTGMEATVEATPGAFWKYDGSGWKMYGTARFADATARNAAIPSINRVKGMTAILTSDEVTYLYDGGAWKAWSSDWISYTPTLANVAIGTGGSAANTAQYRYEQGRVRMKGSAILGTTGASVSGTASFTLPVAAATPPRDWWLLAGSAEFYDLSATVNYLASAFLNASSTTTFTILGPGTNGARVATGATSPFTWAAGDALGYDFVYDPA